jgi:heat shock protein beta
MMKLIINSLYRNKEVYLRELISNASDALDKVRLLSLTDKDQLAATDELSIRIKADKENHVLHITDTGVGMTKQDLINNLGTIAKSGTADFLSKMQEASSTDQFSDLIGQFGVGFYSAFLVADRVVVTTKHNDDVQWIWESDANSYSIVEDPRGDTLKRGTTVSLYLKEESRDNLEHDTIRELVKKYSQFINFNIFMWGSKTETVEEPIEDEEETPAEEEEVKEDKEEDEEGAVEEDKEEEEKAPKTKKVDKTTWDWELCNQSKPIWTRKPEEIVDGEYDEFYKSITKDKNGPMTQTHFIAEGEVTFKSLLFVPSKQESESFNKYGQAAENIKLYVRRVFITDDFKDMMPSYLSFVKGVVDSDDLPLNVSRETLQQHKLLKVIKKKLVRKTLDMIKKISDDKYDAFWKEYSTNIKLGVIEDTANRTRLAKLLRFTSSTGKLASLAQYVERMKDKQEHIFYMAGGSEDEVKTSPFVERLLKKGYEVLFLTEAVDEYAISALPEFEGKKFQNVAKEGFSIDGDTDASKARKEEVKEKFESLTKWMGEEALKDHILRADISERLVDTPCALITSK